MINLVAEFPVVEFITPELMGEEERRAVAKGVTVGMLMENAGRAIAEEIRRRYSPVTAKRITVVAGNGNNGGDGMVAARYLSSMGAACTVVLLGRPEGIKTPEARENWERLSGAGVSFHSADAPDDLIQFAGSIDGADIVLDAILGTGVKGPIRELHAEAIRLINRSGGVTVAIDIPSGLDPLTGEARDPTVRASVTITLHKAKVGLKEREEYTGELVVVPIGIGREGGSS